MRRILMGVSALLFLGAAGGIYVSGVSDENMFLLSVCLRVGLVLGAMWLAYDQVRKIGQRSPPWLLGSIGLCLVVLVVRPKAILIVAPLLAVVAALQFFGWLFKPLPNPRKAAQPAEPPKDGPT